MVISEERAKEIQAMVEDIGIDATADKLNLSRESVRRYSRQARSSGGVPIDTMDISSTMKKLSDVFSEGELRALLEDKKKTFDTPRETLYNFSGDWIKFGVASDWHVGSQYTNESELEYAISEFNRTGCEFAAVPGDITEGMSGRDGHIYELHRIGYKAQRDGAISIASKARFPWKMISGNHDLWYLKKANIGAYIVEDICNRLQDAEYLGEHNGRIYLNGVPVDFWHGEDGASYALSYRIQKIVESMEGGTKPGMLIVGHDHKGLVLPSIRNIVAIGSGSIQHQTPFMKYKKLSASVGFWIIELCIKDKQIIKARTEWNPLYK